MKKGLIALAIVLIILPIAFFGCKGKVDKVAEMTSTAPVDEAMTTPITEPAQTVAMETIPPTAAPQITAKPQAMPQAATATNKDIQTALKNAGFYNGSIDGKIGPKTKSAIQEFQKAKGLKADGKVGRNTWAELEKYLVMQ